MPNTQSSGSGSNHGPRGLRSGPPSWDRWEALRVVTGQGPLWVEGTALSHAVRGALPHPTGAVSLASASWDSLHSMEAGPLALPQAPAEACSLTTFRLEAGVHVERKGRSPALYVASRSQTHPGVHAPGTPLTWPLTRSDRRCGRAEATELQLCSLNLLWYSLPLLEYRRLVKK